MTALLDAPTETLAVTPAAAQAPADAPAADAAPQPPDGHVVLDEARAFLGRFWVPPCPEALDAMALWAAHCHVTDDDKRLAFYSTPRLALVSDEPGSGKTAALELLELLCPRGVRVTDPTAPALLEMIAQHQSTLMIDEVDLLFGGGQSAKSVRAVINSGYRKGAQVARVKGPQDTFAPVALAGLASSFMGNPTLAPTRQRSIIIHCAAPAPGMRPQRFREQLHAGLGTACGQSLATWAESKLMDIMVLWPDMPEGLTGRQEDIWQPLIALADIAGGHWPDTARKACLKFTRGASDGHGAELPPRLRLLADIRAVWPEGADRMASSALLDALSVLPGAPWAAMWTPVQMLQQIPALLGTEPCKIRVDGRPVQGYLRADLARLRGALDVTSDVPANVPVSAA